MNVLVFCLAHVLSSVLFCPSSRGPKETSWTWSDSDLASLRCLLPSDAAGDQWWTPDIYNVPCDTKHTHKRWHTAVHSQHPLCRFPPNSRRTSEWEATQLVKGSVCVIESVDIAICDWPYFLHTWMASITVQEGKALDIKPPNLRMGGDLPLGVHRDRASHIIQRVGTSIRWSKLQSQPLWTLLPLTCRHC